MSINYYEENANQFIEDTFYADMSATYALFTKYLKSGATILDIGCGSGRDSNYFFSQGYDVYAHDGSEAMTAHTKKFLGEKVAVAKFSEFELFQLFGKNIMFDGLWACASLIHVGEEDLVNIVNKYTLYLNSEGVFFLSFKLRSENHEKDGRHFTNFTREKLKTFVAECDGLEIVELLETTDVRAGREDEGWISVVVKKRSEK